MWVVRAEPALQRTSINFYGRARSSSIENESLHNGSRDETFTHDGRKKEEAGGESSTLELGLGIMRG